LRKNWKLQGENSDADNESSDSDFCYHDIHSLAWSGMTEDHYVNNLIRQQDNEQDSRSYLQGKFPDAKMCAAG